MSALYTSQKNSKFLTPFRAAIISKNDRLVADKFDKYGIEPENKKVTNFVPGRVLYEQISDVKQKKENENFSDGSKKKNFYKQQIKKKFPKKMIFSDQ